MNKEHIEKYEGRFLEDFKHIEELSSYNYNFYIGLKRGSRCDLVLAISDDDNETDLFLIDISTMTKEEFGYCYLSDDDRIKLL